MDLLSGFGLLIIGVFSGAYGMIVGAGGGFIFVPALLILFHLPPSIAAGTGLAVVWLNSISGIYGYYKEKRIDYKLGIVLSVGALPGTIAGVFLGESSSSGMFYIIFASMLICLGIFLFIKKPPAESKNELHTREVSASLDKETEQRSVLFTRETISILLTGVLLGVVSSYLGIGGGWLLVPILIYLYKVSPRIATATSIFSLCLYTSFGMIIQIFEQHIHWSALFFGGVGVIIGAQLGVYLSSKLSGQMIVKMLSILLIGVGLKLFMQ